MHSFTLVSTGIYLSKEGKSGRGTDRGRGRHSSWDAYHEDPRLRECTPEEAAAMDEIHQEIDMAQSAEPSNVLHEPGGLDVARKLLQQGLLDGRV